MKLFTICSTHHIRAVLLVCMTLFASSLHAQNQEMRLSLTLSNATLETFVKQIERATGFAFVYGEEVKLTSRISLDSKQQPLNEVLQKTFDNQPIRFEISGKHIVLQKRGMPQKPVSRKFTISGYVTDGASSETLIGANILESRHATGTATNPFGFYTLTLPQGETNLTYSYLGYKNHHTSFQLTSDTLINIRLDGNNQLAEVVVLSAKREAGIQSTAMGAHEIPMAQIKHTPTVLGEADLLKTIQLMPGVQAGMEGFSGMYVRGGGPDQNLILLDGIPVYNADHFMGLFSIFTPEAVKKVTLYKSSFPARYGGRLSSIVDVRTNDGDMNRYHGTISVGMLTNKLHFEGPIWKDRTSFIVSARTTHTALLSGVIATEGETFNYYFYDFNAKINHKFSDRSRLFLGVYRGGDRYHFDIEENNKTYWNENNTYTNKYNIKNNLNWGNTIASARWNYVFNNRLFSNTTVAYNNYHMKLQNSAHDRLFFQGKPSSSYLYDIQYKSGIRDYSARIDFDYIPTPTHHIKFGGEYINHTFRPETTTSRIKEEQSGVATQDTLYGNNLDNQLRGHEMSLYAEDNFDIGTRFSLNAGIHFSWFNTQGSNYIATQPRLSARYRFTPHIQAKASYACMAQYVHLLSGTPLSTPADLWVPITKNIRPMYSNQYSLGGYYTGIPGWEFSVEGYYKQLRNVLEYKDGASVFGSSINWEDKVEAGQGRAMGIEFMVQKTVGKTSGWASYTLSKADRQFKDGSISNGKRFPYKYDRRHSFNITLNHKFSQRIDVGASWIYHTGGNISVPERETIIIRPDGNTEAGAYLSQRNNYRLPANHRLNLGINFNKKTKHGMRTWNVSLYNAYNAQNPNLVYAQWKKSETTFYPNNEGAYVPHTKDATVKIKKLTILPLLPSVSYTYKF